VSQLSAHSLIRREDVYSHIARRDVATAGGDTMHSFIRHESQKRYRNRLAVTSDKAERRRKTARSMIVHIVRDGFFRSPGGWS
jgi:hypothetical protein